MAKKALGKGLSALIPQKEKQTKKSTSAKNKTTTSKEPQNGLMELPLSQITKNTYQPRTVFKEENLNDLIASIKENGLLQPVVVKQSSPGKYELIAGERRFRACKALGLKKIPAIIKKASKEQSLELALIENIQRHNLNPIEEALAYLRLSEEFTLTQEEISKKIGKTRTAVTNAIRLLKLPKDVQDLIAEQKLSMGHARALLGLENQQTQTEAARLIIEKDLSVRETEKLVRHSPKNKKPAKKKKETNELSSQVKSFEETMQRVLGTKVNIVGKASKGKIEINYYSLEDLHRICEIFDIDSY